MFPQGLYRMPIPGMDEEHDIFYDRATWRLKFIWLPKLSYLTGRWIWLQFAYEGQVVWFGPGDPVREFRYHETVEHLVWQLKQ